MRWFLSAWFICSFVMTFGQEDTAALLQKIDELERKVSELSQAELIQSMSQRSLLTPSYFPELKALIAKQAYEFWQNSSGEKYVSHMNVYSALYYANKYLGYDTINSIPYNQVIGHTEAVTSLRFGLNPKFFYSAGSDGRVIKWNASDLKAIPEIIYKGEHLIRKLDISHDDRWIMIVTKNDGIKLLDTESNENGSSIIEDKSPIQTAAFIPGKSSFLAVTNDGKLIIRGIDEDELIGQTKGRINTIAISDQTSQVFLGAENGNIEVWTDTLESQFFIKEAFAINSLAISPDHKILAIGREKGDVILWDMVKEKLIRSISSHQSAIMEVNFSPDGKRLLTASRDKTVRVWDLQNGKKLPLLLDDHEDWVMTAVFDPKGEFVFSGAKDKRIRVWPIRHDKLANRICDLVSRNMTELEWEEYVGNNVPYQSTCD